MTDLREVEALALSADLYALSSGPPYSFVFRNGAATLRALVAECETLTAQLAAARADAERYKWWAQNPIRVTYWDNDGEDFYRPCDAFGRITGPPMPLISAIDAAKGGRTR